MARRDVNLESSDVTGSILQLGRDHATWGEYTLRSTAEGRTAVAISVGSDPRSPSMRSKGSRLLPNEDAALAMEDADRTLLAVADAHHGVEASHVLLAAIEAAGIPANFDGLLDGLRELGPLPGLDESATTLVVAVLERHSGSGYGVSFGDSSLMRVGPGGAHVINVRLPAYVDPRRPRGVDPDFGHAFHFFLEPDELLVAFTDGINECHYRSPETSIQGLHIARVFESSQGQPERFARELVELALAGVDGNPGGQDNIALAVTSVGRAR